MPGNKAAGWRRRFGLSQPRLLLRAREDTLLVEYSVEGAGEPLGRWPWPISPLELESHLGARVATLPRYWVLPADAVVRRVLELPAAAQARLDDLAKFEVQRQTPFTADNALYQVRLLERGSATTPLKAELVAAPRRLWDALGEEWRACLAGVEVEEGSGVLGVNLLPSNLRKRPPDPLRFGPWLLAGLALLLLFGAAFQWLDNRRQVRDTLRKQVEAASPGARQEAGRIQTVREQVEGIIFLDGRRAATPATGIVWGEVTQRLPEGTYLDRLTLQRGRLQLSGLSTDAAQLVTTLQDSPHWRAPALDSVQRESAGSRRDRFVLSAKVGPERAP